MRKKAVANLLLRGVRRSLTSPSINSLSRAYGKRRPRPLSTLAVASEASMVTHHSSLDDARSPREVHVDSIDQNSSALIDLLLQETEELMNLAETSLHVSCYSGGVDSSLATTLLANVGPDIRAVLGVSPAVSSEQLQQARRIASDIMHLYPNVSYSEVATNEGTSEIYLENSGQACWACKTHLYSSMQAVVRHVDTSIASGRHQVQLYNGTNMDDTQDPTRVGLKAAREFRVRSPLQSITKAQVRIVAKALGLENWNAAASPCLRSRLALGVEATQDHLQKIEFAERRVRELLGDFDDPTLNLRVRMLSKQRARIEVDGDLVDHVEQNILSQVESYFVGGLGFSAVSVCSFRSGSVAASSEGPP